MPPLFCAHDPINSGPDEIIGSAAGCRAPLGACGVVAAGILWGIDPPIPTSGPIGPNLPFGWATGSSIIASGLIAMALPAYSIRRFRPEALRERESARR